MKYNICPKSMYTKTISKNVFLTVPVMKVWRVMITVSRPGTALDVYLSREILPIQMSIESMNITL
jgi:hypothetical protein